MASQLLFSGFAQIYMEGKGVLSPYEWYDEKEVTYFIGSPTSKYKIIDKRTEVNQMAITAINNGGMNWSPEVFCKPCFIEINKDQEDLTVLLHDRLDGKLEFPIVWIGTMEGEDLTAYPVVWLQYADIENGRAAFIGVIDPDLSLFSDQISISVEN